MQASPFTIGHVYVTPSTACIPVKSLLEYLEEVKDSSDLEIIAASIRSLTVPNIFDREFVQVSRNRILDAIIEHVELLKVLQIKLDPFVDR